MNELEVDRQLVSGRSTFFWAHVALYAVLYLAPLGLLYFSAIGVLPFPDGMILPQLAGRTFVWASESFGHAILALAGTIAALSIALAPMVFAFRSRQKLLMTATAFSTAIFLTTLLFSAGSIDLFMAAATYAAAIGILIFAQ